MEAYLLGDGGILLDPDLVYVDPEGFKTGFCVIPGRKEDFNSQLSLFIQYLMKHILKGVVSIPKEKQAIY